MDKIEVTQNARQAAFDAYLTCYESVPNDLWLQALLDGKHDGDEMAQAFARFERDILATRTDATPVAWMYELPEENVRKFYQTRFPIKVPGWTETPLYTHPPATDVAALVEAANEAGDWMEQLRACGDAGNWNWSEGDEYSNLIAALAPFTKGQNDG